MRERLVVAFVGLTLASLALFAVPRAYATADLVAEQDQRSAERTAVLMADVVDARLQAGTTPSESMLAELLGPGEGVRLDTDDVVVSAGSLSDDVVVSTDLASGGTLTVTTSASGTQGRIADALLPLVVLGLALAVLAGVVGWFIAGRLAHPFRVLADATDSFTGRGTAPDLPPFTIPEAERLRVALHSAVVRIAGQEERERQLAAQASHELRTPVTALRLSLEDLSLWPETAPEVAAELGRAVGELDRLDAAVTGLLERPDEGVAVDLGRLVEHGVERWSASSGVEVVVPDEADPLPTRIDPGAFLPVLEAMLDDSRDAPGPIEVEVRTVGAGVEIRVGDAGPRRMDPGHVHRLGPEDGDPLSVAGERAEALGGHLRVDDSDRHRLVLTLPHRD